jgi:hypothetical protein
MRNASFVLLLAGLLALALGVIPLVSGAEKPLTAGPPEAVPAAPEAGPAPPAPTPEAPPVATPEPTPEAPAPPEPTPAPEPPAPPTPEPAPAEPETTPAPAEPAAAPQAEPAARAVAPPAAEPVAAAQASVRVCHFTGSTTIPYVLVEAPAGGGEHAAHGDDIIPAPAGGCPATYQGPQGPPDEPQPPPPSGEVTLCHATGQAANPFVELTIRRSRLAEHRRHARDIIPVPATGCPVRAADGDDSGAPVPPAPRKRPAPRTRPRPAPTAAPVPAATVAPVAATPAPAPQAPRATFAASIPGLPHTGADLALMAMFGLGLMSMGAGLRLLTEGR